jgi:hypothetical protein
MSEDRPKKSWREIDAQRDKSRSGSAPRAPRPGKKEEVKSKQYRAALDALFEKGGWGKVAEVLGRPETKEPAAPPPPSENPRAPAPPAPPDPAEVNRAAMKKKIVEAIGRDEVTRAVDRYVAKWPLPAEWEVLEQALDHTEEARVAEVLSTLELLAAREKPRRARTLVGKLRLLEETGPEALRPRAAALRHKLG